MQYLTRCDFRSSHNHGSQHSENIVIDVVSLSVSSRFPQADGKHLDPVRRGKCDFVLEPLLSAQQREYVFLKSLGEFGKFIRFQPGGEYACKHYQAPWL